MQKVKSAVHTLKIPTEDVSRGSREAGLNLEGIHTLLCLQPQVGWGFISHPSKGSTPEPAKSAKKNRWQMHERR